MLWKMSFMVKRPKEELTTTGNSGRKKGFART